MNDSVAPMDSVYRKIPILQEGISYSRPAARVFYNLRMDEVRNLVRSRAKELKLTLAKLSRDIGRNPTYLQQFITKGSPERLDETDRAKLAELLAVEETQLGGPGRGKIQPRGRILGSRQLGVMIPVYGHAAGGSNGEFPLNGNQIGEVVAPPLLAGARDAYAVYVVGESMVPRYEAGEAVYVNPHIPIRHGDYVVAQIAGEEGDPPAAYVKKFLGNTARHLRLEQLNPHKVLEFPSQRVVSVHRIVLGGDG